MEKVVLPQFVADYIDKQYGGNKPHIGDKAELIRDWGRYVVSCGDFRLAEWVDDDNNFLTFVMAIATNNYEVEEEKKYYWKRKSEHSLKVEEPDAVYLNYYVDRGTVFFGSIINGKMIKTKLTEKEVLSLVGEEDFNKLEKVEIEQVVN